MSLQSVASKPMYDNENDNKELFYVKLKCNNLSFVCFY